MHFPSIKTSLATALGVFCLGLPVASGAQTTPTPLPTQTTPTPLPTQTAPVPLPTQTEAPPSNVTTETVPVLSGDYQLAPDDQVDISVEGHSEFDKTVVVLPQGTFSYFGHMVRAAGLTQDALTQTLTHALKGQLRYPEVTVSVRQAHIRQISVLGAAHSPGKYPYMAGMHIIDVLADSGGPAQTSEMTDATLFTNNGTTSEPIDLVKLMQGTDPSLNKPVQPGDVLFLQARNPATAMVLIRGQVAHEGQYPVRPEGATIMAILTQAGGMTGGAAITRVQLTHDGKTRVLNMRPTLFDTTAPVGQTPIVAGDTIAVPLNNAKYMVLGEVNSRNVYPLPDGEPVTVTRALAQAGGPTGETDLKSVEIIRATGDGKMQYIPVNVDDILNRKSVNDPVLQDADILFFPKRKHGGNTTGAAQGILGGLFSFSALSNLLRGGL